MTDRRLEDKVALITGAGGSIGQELGRYGITVNAIGVGPTLNQRNLRDDPEYAAHWADVVPVGRAARSRIRAARRCTCARTKPATSTAPP